MSARAKKASRTRRGVRGGKPADNSARPHGAARRVPSRGVVSALTLCAALLLLLLSSGAVPARADRVDEIIRARMRERHVPGLALVVARGGKVVKEGAYGLSNVELGVAATPETVFEIGSITKQLTAAAVLMLVEDGRVRLDDPVGKHLPNAPAAWGGVTVRHLLTHTSGVKTYTGLSGFELSRRLKRDDFIKALAAHPLDFAPGARYSYSNSGYNLLGHVIESASGQGYWDFMRARIFRPLGMSKTGDRDPRLLHPGRADGYEWDGAKLVGRDHDLTDVFSAGAVVSTVRDLARWDAALYTERLLKDSTRAAMWSPARLNGGRTHPYGFGWNTLDFRGQRLVSHGGQTAGFAANISRYLDERLTVIVLCNLGDVGLASEIARRVSKEYLPGLSLRALKPAPDAEPHMTAALRQVFRERLDGQTGNALLTKQARAAFESARGRETARRLAAYGPARAFDFIEREDGDEGARALRYRAVFGTRALLLRFNLDAENKVAGMSVEEEEE